MVGSLWYPLIMPKIILASQSPQRKLLMQALGIPFEVMPADIDEKGIIESDQKLRAKLIAKAKAEEKETRPLF